VSAADEAAASRRTGKRASAFRTIGEVAGDLDVPAHVLRFWESKFPQLKPLKRAGGRRYYRPEDVQLLQRIRQCLYKDGYTIRGVQRLLNEGVAEQVASAAVTLLSEDATLFPLKPLPPPPARPATRPGLTGLSAELRTALDEIRNDLLAVKELVERLNRG